MFGIAQRVVRAHPIVLTLAVLVPWAGLVVSNWTLPPVLQGALMALPFGAMCGWWWAVLVVARTGSKQRASGRWDWVFAIPPLLALIAGLAGLPTNNSPVAFAIFITIFVCLTISAKALEKADASDSAPSVGRILATFLLMYLAPLGVWILHSKIVGVAERSLVTAQA